MVFLISLLGRRTASLGAGAVRVEMSIRTFDEEDVGKLGVVVRWEGAEPCYGDVIWMPTVPRATLTEPHQPGVSRASHA